MEVQRPIEFHAVSVKDGGDVVDHQMSLSRAQSEPQMPSISQAVARKLFRRDANLRYCIYIYIYIYLHTLLYMCVYLTIPQLE